MRTWIVLAALINSALIAVANAGPAVADGLDLSRSPAAALSPGVGIGTYNADTTPAQVCTAGWLVHDAAGWPGVLTAGGCFHGGGAVFYSTDRGYEGVGRFTEHDDTLAMLGINNARTATGPIRTDTRIIGIRPTVAPADPAGLRVGQRLCAYGAASGLRCGPITAANSPATVEFAVPSAAADTGGPVYYRDQAAAPVGITLSGDDDSTRVALLGPWLRRWQLTVETTGGPHDPAAAAGFRCAGRPC